MNIKNNVYNEKDTEQIITQTIDELFEALATTVGPFGTNAIIQDGSNRHTISKDGYTLLKSIFYSEDIPRTVLEFIKRISRKLVMTVGDGSTSSVLISKFLYDEIKKFTNANTIPPRTILGALSTIAAVLEKHLLKNAIPIDFSLDSDSIQRVAAISLNNDYTTALKIANIYKEIGKYCKIQIESSKTGEDYWERKSAFEFTSTYKIEQFLEENGKAEVKREDLAIFMSKDTLTYDEVPMFTHLAGYLGNKGKSLIIIAKDFDNDFINFVKTNKNLNKSIKFDVHLVTIALASKLSKESFNDLAVYLDCRPYERDSYGKAPEYISSENTPSDVEAFQLVDLGVANSIRITENKTFIINDDGEPSESIKNRVELLKEERDNLAKLSSELDRDLEIVKLEGRIAQLEKTAVVFYAGGYSEEEKENRKYLLEDAVAAVKSAIEYGYNVGGSVNIPFLLNSAVVIKEIKEKLDQPVLYGLIDLVAKAFLSIYDRVMLNAKINKDTREQRIELAKRGILVNILTNEDEAINNKNIKTIQSVQTDIEILKASLSIIGLLATSKIFISLNLNRTEI